MQYIFGASNDADNDNSGLGSTGREQHGADDGMLALLVDRLESSTSTQDILEILQELKVRC